MAVSRANIIEPLQDVKLRINTFRSWPINETVASDRLAKAGFYYTGVGTEVECFACRARISDWSVNDQAIGRHQSLSPNCPFVKQRSKDRRPQPARPSSLRTLSTGSSSSSSSESDLPPSPPGQANYHNNWMNSARPTLSEQDRRALKREDVRFRTFQGRWNVSFVEPRDLAKAGFFFVGHEDQVQCAFCAGVIGHWERSDVPMDEHKRHFSICPFVRAQDVGNVPIEVASNDTPVLNLPPPVPGGYDICERYLRSTNMALTDNVTRRNPVSAQLSIDSPGSLEALGINEHRGPEHPDKTTYEARLKTFSNWHHYDRQAPERLAEAGFFYLGESDKVKCFHCDMGLCNWERTDNPWVEHAKWFSKCIFVMQTKGEKFVKQVLDTVKRQAKNDAGSARNVMKEEIKRDIEGPIAKAALEIVQDPRKVRQAILNKWRNTGSGFAGADGLVIAALEIPDEPERSQSQSMSTGVDVPPEPRSLTGNPSSEVEEPIISMSGVEQQEGSDVAPSAMRMNTPEPASPPSVAAVEEASIDVPPSPSSNHSYGEAMEVENIEKAIEERYKCKVCLDQRIEVIFLPCGHLASCSTCAPALANCPLCRHVIRGTAKVFLP